MSRDIYIAIMVAAAKGKQMALSVDEVCQLSRDEAIIGAAMNGLEEADFAGQSHPDWKKINPLKPRTPGNLRC